MIYHFLYRDFLSNKINWVICLIITLVCMVTSVYSPEILTILGVCLMFFAVIPLQSLTGAAWRSQHVMSRNYLLSLPVPRNKMFFMVQMRAVVFAVPIIIYTLVMPFCSDFFNSVVSYSPRFYPIYVFTVLLAIVWMINIAIYSNLIFEKITTYLTKLDRTKAWSLSMAVFFSELAVVAYCFLKSEDTWYATLIGLGAVSGVAAYRYYKTRRSWLG